jgi:hemoglobin
MSLYDELGGSAAIAVALDRFYEKVLDDGRIAHYFSDVKLDRLKERQASFLAMAFGGPGEYAGPDLHSAHKRARKRGLDEGDYHVFMGHFEDTLAELAVPREKIDEVMAIAHTGKSDVLAS